jgi:hypothetical protein
MVALEDSTQVFARETRATQLDLPMVRLPQ